MSWQDRLSVAFLHCSFVERTVLVPMDLSNTVVFIFNELECMAGRCGVDVAPSLQRVVDFLLRVVDISQLYSVFYNAL